MSLPLFPDEPRVIDGPLPPVDRVPYQPSSATSREGAEQAAEAAQRQCQRLLALYREHPEGLTDAEAATALGLERTTTIPRRHALMRAGLVVEKSSRVNERSGVRNTVYGVQ